MIASPCKLKSGAWGARVPSTTVRSGDRITIRAASGKTWDATVAAIVWRGSDVTIVSTSTSASTNTSTKRCRGCGGAIRHAAHHRAMGGYCGDCAFDEFDC